MDDVRRLARAGNVLRVGRGKVIQPKMTLNSALRVYQSDTDYVCKEKCTSAPKEMKDFEDV